MGIGFASHSFTRAGHFAVQHVYTDSFLQLKQSLSNLRFIGAVLTANFVVVPVIVSLLTWIFPQSPAVLIGVYLVLLTPCIDYVIVLPSLDVGMKSLCWL